MDLENLSARADWAAQIYPQFIIFFRYFHNIFSEESLKLG
jgi:hypothetical protein